MAINFKVIDYYENDLHKPYNLTIKEPGIYYIVGPNGSGKTSLLHQLKEYGENNGYEILSYSDTADGRGNSISKLAYHNQFSDVANLMMSSEGESIYYNFGFTISSIGTAIRFNKKAFILIDGIDSGMSIDKLKEIRDIFDNIVAKDIVGKDIYIFITANNFELVRGDVYCVNPINGHKVHFNSYKGFENYICGYKYKYLGVEKDE